MTIIVCFLRCNCNFHYLCLKPVRFRANIYKLISLKLIAIPVSHCSLRMF